jgi:single-strand DNA-binding protein
MIKTQIIGHLGKDAVVNTVNGKTVINFSVAHTEKFKDATGQQRDKTTWVDCSNWTDKTAIAPYLKKGTQVYVEGTPDSRAYLNADNKPASSISLRVSSIQLLGSPEKNEVTNAEGKREYAPNPAPIAEEDGDLPF